MTEHAGTKHYVSRSLYKALKENERAERGYFIAVAHTHTQPLNLNLDICKYKEPLTPLPRGPFGFHFSPATTVHLAFLSVLLSLLLTLSLSSVLGILGLIFWNLSRKWGTWEKKIKRACLSYLLLPNTPPQNLAAENKSHFIISILWVSWSPAECRFHWFPMGHLTAAVRQRGARPSRWFHSQVWLGGWAQVGLSTPITPGPFSWWALHKIPPAGLLLIHTCSRLQNTQEHKLPGLPKASARNR